MLKHPGAHNTEPSTCSAAYEYGKELSLNLLQIFLLISEIPFVDIFSGLFKNNSRVKYLIHVANKGGNPDS